MADGRLVRAVNWVGIAAAVVGVLAIIALTAFKAVEQKHQSEALAASLTGGDPRTGRDLIDNLGCASCHTIPGIHRANATVGPPLSHFASRSYIAGTLPNSPGNLHQWLLDPPSVHHATAMPNLNLSDDQARDIAAYLYTLK